MKKFIKENYHWTAAAGMAGLVAVYLALYGINSKIFAIPFWKKL